MFFLTRCLIARGVRVQFLMGASSTQHLLARNRVQELGASVQVCTDDGSQGVRALVTDLMEEVLAAGTCDYFYACGPEGMLKTAQSKAAQHKLRGELSLEAYMACGVGACLGCSHRVLKDGEEAYARVCKDGPVFPAEEVLF
jgi:dihydroorotate dehydrogenase electron transfer subunit